MILKIDHVGVAVDDLEKGLRFWEKALGLHLGGTETIDTEGVRVAFLSAGESRIELLEPISPDSPIARFLARKGQGLNHMTLMVDDLDQALERLAGSDVEVLGEAPRKGAGGTRVAFLHPRSCTGVLLELVEGPPATVSEKKDIEEGSAVLVYLREPVEKLWGVLRRIDGNGMVVEGIDLASFDDWVSQVEKDEESVVGPSVMFLPMTRIERILLDRTSGSLPSMADRFFQRVGRPVTEVLG